MRRSRPLKLTALMLGLTAFASACSGSKPTVALSGDPRAALAPRSIPTFLAADPEGRFSTLLACIELGGAAEALSGPGPITLFAPTNEAFSKAGISCNADDALAAEAKVSLLRTLQQHVVPYDVRFTEPDDYDPDAPPRRLKLVGSQSVIVDSVLIDASGTELVIGAAKTVRPQAASAAGVADVTDADLQAPNGIVQVIDEVLIPPTKPALPPTTAAPKPYE